MHKTILYRLTEKLKRLCEDLGFSKQVVRINCGVSEIYVVNRHALQLEVDWRENNLFMYAVYLKNNSLPDKEVIYNYGDGHWCKKYLEEIYQVERPIIKDRNRRYSTEYLFDCFAFYAELIKSNTDLIKNFGVTGELASSL